MSPAVRSAACALAALLPCVAARGEIPFERTEDFAPVTVGPRVRQTSRTFVYAETVGQYSLFQNFLHRWLDRPLHFSRSLRPTSGKFVYSTPECFRMARDEAMRYGIDGFGVFGNYRGRIGPFKEMVAWNHGREGEFAVLPLVFYTLSGDGFVASADGIVNLIRTAGAPPVAVTADGRKLLGVYNFRSATVDAQRQLLDEVRKLAKDERYALPGQLEERVVMRLARNFRKAGRLTDDERAELERMVDGVLAATDGLHLRESEYWRPADASYMSYIDHGFLDGCLRPVLLAAYARPENRGKVLSFHVMQGYLNNLSGMNHGEFGTRSLRRCMASALALNPDFLLLFEWNEENENTMFQPTVRNGEAVGRIMHWYSCLLRGESASPYGSDDNAVPSITLSYRVTFKPGERLEFELLNVPSGEAVPSHTVRLALQDREGRCLRAFPQETLRTDVFGAVTYAVPGEAFPVGAPIVPVLTVDGRAVQGFHPIRPDATRCVDYKCVRQSLRDLPAMAKQTFRLQPSGAPGEYAFEADIACAEELTSVELVCDEDEVAAFDPTNEYDRDRFDIVRLAMYTAPGFSGPAPLQIAVTGAPGVQLRQEWKANVNPGRIETRGDGVFGLRTQWFADETPYFLLLPKGTAATAVAHFSSDFLMGTGVTSSIPLQVVLERGFCAVAPDAKRGFRIDARRFDALPDVPPPLHAKSVSWRGKVRSDSPAPVFHLREIASSGRIWRSHPVAPPAADLSRSETLPVYSEWERRAKDVMVPSALIPSIEYDFTPDCGAAIAAKGMPRHGASLGGGYVYCDAFNGGRAFREASPGFANAPEWVREDGRWLLRFDGGNDYLHAPNETFPIGAFTLKAEFRPRYGAENMVVFRHAGQGRGSLQLFIVRGRLYAMWADRDYYDSKLRTARFDTGLEVANGEWNALEASYDLRTIRFRLNGREWSKPFDRRAYLFRPMLFGGHAITTDIAPSGPLVWFKGDLRALSVRHR